MFFSFLVFSFVVLFVAVLLFCLFLFCLLFLLFCLLLLLFCLLFSCFVCLLFVCFVCLFVIVVLLDTVYQPEAPLARPETPGELAADYGGWGFNFLVILSEAAVDIT